ncbi:MAG: NfeD family protein [Neisseria sp.]|nr:NfeD family protein [Neisseria sp.]
MNSWFIAASAILIIELFVGTIYLLVVSAALFGAGLVAGLTGNADAAMLTAAVLSALGVWPVYLNLKKRRLPKAAADSVPDDLDIGQTVHVLRHLHGDIYEVSYRGAQWQARFNAGPNNPVRSDSDAVITGKNGNVLLIQPN